MEYMKRTLTKKEETENIVIECIHHHRLRDISCRIWPNPECSDLFPGLYVICASSVTCGHCIISEPDKLVEDVCLYDRFFGGPFAFFSDDLFTALENLKGKKFFIEKDE